MTKRGHLPGLVVPTGITSLWKPFDGFQTLACQAGEDSVLIGGAKGSGKSSVLVGLAAGQVNKWGYKALITRQSFPEMQDLIERAHQLYPKLGKPHWDGENRTFRWPLRTSVTFGYLDKLADCRRYQGQEWSRWFNDETGNQRDERVLDTLEAEIRCKNPEVHVGSMHSANPGGVGHAMLKRRYIVPTLEGKQKAWDWVDIQPPPGLPKIPGRWFSRRFIPGRVWDNPIYANDNRYISRLMLLPQRIRKYLLDGSWEDPQGVAFDMLSRARHFVRVFDPPKHWTWWAGYDWGIAHPAVFTYGVMDEDGNAYVVDTIWLIGHTDVGQAKRIRERAPMEKIGSVPAGHDVFAVHKKEEHTETTATRFEAEQIFLRHAILDRRARYLNMCTYLEWRPDEMVGIPERVPKLRFMNTPGNRRLFAQMETLVMDPDDPGKVLKEKDYRVDSLPRDVDEPIPGDDGFDGLSYGLQDHPAPAPSMFDVDRTQMYSPLQSRVQMPEADERDHRELDSDEDSMAWG